GGFGEVKGKAAPARADVEHAISGREQELGGDVTLLGELRVVERLVRRFEIGAAVLPVGIEEERVEARVEVVMMGCVAPRAAAPIEPGRAASEVAHHR